MKESYRPEWPSKTDYAIGICGAGGIVNDAHLPAYRKAGFRVDCIYDVDRSRAEETAARFEIPRVCDFWNRLLKRLISRCGGASLGKQSGCRSAGRGGVALLLQSRWLRIGRRP